MNSRMRHQKILELLSEQSIATMNELINYVDCSPATLRRDLSELHQEGKLKKIRNGAEQILAPSSTHASGFDEFYPNISDYSDYGECDRIAKKAVSICQPKDSVFIGEGQINFLMGKYLFDQNIHVYSNYLPLITYLISQQFPHLVVLGGQYIRSQSLLVSAESTITYQGRYLFVSGDGLTEAGLTKSSLLSYMEEKKMLAYADKVVVLISSEGLGVFGGMSVFGLNELDIVITGKKANNEIVAELQNNHVAVFQV